MVLKLHAAVGAFKITKRPGLDKTTETAKYWPFGRFCSVFALLLTAYLSADAALALPVTIAWDLPLIHAESYLLELSSSPGFGDTILKQEVKGTGYTGEVPAEGVYHWRLSRPGMKSESQEGVETSIFASGSFVALDSDVKRLSPPRITWDKVADAQRYKVYMLGPNANQRVVTVSTNSFIVTKVDEPTMIEVVPFTEGRRTTRGYRMDTSLTLQSGALAAAAGTPPLAPSVLVTTTTTTTESPGEPRRRRHLVYVFAEGVQEQLEVQKLELDLKSTQQEAGGGAGFWLNPAYGLVLSGQADYHEHNDTEVKQQRLYPGRQLTINQSRYTGDFSIGYNLLDFFGVRRVVFAVAAAAVMTQLPMVPPEAAVAAPAVPPLNKTRLSMVGGSAQVAYLGKYVSLLVEAGGVAESANKGRLTYERALLDIYLGSLVSLEVGGYYRATQASRCAADAATCLATGSSRIHAEEAAVMLGLGVVLF